MNYLWHCNVLFFDKALAGRQTGKLSKDANLPIGAKVVWFGGAVNRTCQAIHMNKKREHRALSFFVNVLWLDIAS